MGRILLPSGCSYSVPNVHPKNWKTLSASTKKPWYITYRFYDPELRDRFPHGKYKMLKGMNDYADLKQRQASTRQLLEELRAALEDDGYNPIRETAAVPQTDYLIAPSTPLHMALQAAKERLNLAKSTLDDIQVTLRGFHAAAVRLGFHRMSISNVERRHVIAILDQCEEINEHWSPARFNKYKANLSIVWKELREVEAVQVNIIRDISPKKGTVKKMRQTLTKEERRAINAFLYTHYHRFWIFLQCFFHGGARETEMMRLKGKHVDIKHQQIKFLVLKGREYVEKIRPIKDIAVPFWQIALEECGPEDFVFSKGLMPGAVKISPRQITQRWRKHVKGKKESRGEGKNRSTLPKLGFEVTADFYSLKHTNLDEVAEQLGLAAAARQAGHSNTRMVEEHYAVGEKARQAERLRKVRNAFA